MRRTGIQTLHSNAEQAPRDKSFPWTIIAVVGLVLAVGGYLVWAKAPEEVSGEPPLSPLEPSALAKYLELAGVEDGGMASLFTVDETLSQYAESLDESAANVSAEIHHRVATRQGTRWPSEDPLSRRVYSASRAFAALSDGSAREVFYPLEIAVLTAAVLRQQGETAMVAEAWSFEGERSPPDPSGSFGYFVVAVYEDEVGQGSPEFFDPYRGRLQPPQAEHYRVLKDTEVVAATLGTDALRDSIHGGHRAGALAKVEQALRLDPRSPNLRNAHAATLMESGGFEEAMNEIESALQLRDGAPQQINMAQIHLAQAGLFQASGDSQSSSREMDSAARRVTQALTAQPDYARAHLALATIQLATGDSDLARASLETAERLDPESASLPLIWAQYYLARGELEEAVVQAERASDRRPENWQVHVNAAQVLHAAGRFDAMRAHLSKALEQVPPNDRAVLRKQLEATLGPMAFTDEEPGQDATPNLGDPTKLQLRDPAQGLRLDLNE